MFVVVNFDSLAQASNFRIERRQVVFLCRMQDSKLGSLRYQFASRLNVHSQTHWAIEDQAKNLYSTTRPNDEWAFSPFEFMPIGFCIGLWRYTCLLFVVNFDVLAKASDLNLINLPVELIDFYQQNLKRVVILNTLTVANCMCVKLQLHRLH